jgi:hypothetical protein
MEALRGGVPTKDASISDAANRKDTPSIRKMLNGLFTCHDGVPRMKSAVHDHGEHTRMRPRLSVVMPSFNQGKFLEDAIRSVLDQSYENLEYIVVDGGSTDESLDILQAYGPQLTHWVSEPDKGQYDAINKGFARTTGDIMAWLNSDDKYMPWTLSLVADIFAAFPHVEWLTSVRPVLWNEQGQPTKIDCTGGISRRSFAKGGNFSGKRSFGRRWIQQESTFWRRSLWERSGARLDTNYPLAADFELWARLFQHADLYGVDAILGGFRMHGDQRSVLQHERYLQECEQILVRNGHWPCSLAESLLRGGLWTMLRPWSLTLPPSPFDRMLTAMGLLYPAPIVAWSGNNWELTTGFSL